MCLLLETIKIENGEPQNLKFHEERMSRSRKSLYGKGNIIRLRDYITSPPDIEGKAVKCRIVYGKEIVSVDYSLYEPVKITSLKIVHADHIIYDHKYLDRSELNELKDNCRADDVLIVKDGCVTDVTFANIVFTNGKDWITPDTPLLPGTMRESLLRSGVIKQSRITPRDLSTFSHFRLINAMLGFNAPVIPVSNIIITGSSANEGLKVHGK